MTNRLKCFNAQCRYNKMAHHSNHGCQGTTKNANQRIKHACQGLAEDSQCGQSLPISHLISLHRVGLVQSWPTGQMPRADGAHHTGNAAGQSCKALLIQNKGNTATNVHSLVSTSSAKLANSLGVCEQFAAWFDAHIVIACRIVHLRQSDAGNVTEPGTLGRCDQEVQDFDLKHLHPLHQHAFIRHLHCCRFAIVIVRSRCC